MALHWYLKEIKNKLRVELFPVFLLSVRLRMLNQAGQTLLPAGKPILSACCFSTTAAEESFFPTFLV